MTFTFESLTRCYCIQGAFKFKDMNRSKLFLVCPDCHLEMAVQKHFKGNLYFLTALGSVFNTTCPHYAESIDTLVVQEHIEEVIVVNDCSCRFIQTVLNNDKGYETCAEEVLQVLHYNCQIELLAEKNIGRRAFKLAELNIQQQADSLKETSFIGERIERKKIRLRGLIYERDKGVFSEVEL